MGTFPYKKALVIGSTSGIGLELAERLVGQGVAVIAVGRRQKRLDRFVSKVGVENACGVAFDIGNVDRIPIFAQRYQLSPYRAQAMAHLPRT